MIEYLQILKDKVERKETWHGKSHVNCPLLGLLFVIIVSLSR